MRRVFPAYSQNSIFSRTLSALFLFPVLSWYPPPRCIRPPVGLSVNENWYDPLLLCQIPGLDGLKSFDMHPVRLQGNCRKRCYWYRCGMPSRLHTHACRLCPSLPISQRFRCRLLPLLWFSRRCLVLLSWYPLSLCTMPTGRLLVLSDLKASTT